MARSDNLSAATHELKRIRAGRRRHATALPHLGGAVGGGEPVMPQETGARGIVDLDDLDRAGLQRAWEQTFGAAPPRYLARAFMRRVLAHERQCRRYGGHSAATRRALAAMANGKPGGAVERGSSVSAGTHLVRDWNGRTYRVEVIDGGYRFDGKTYPSLTAIAKRITGTNWSGPRFFGLTPRRSA